MISKIALFTFAVALTASRLTVAQVAAPPAAPTPALLQVAPGDSKLAYGLNAFRRAFVLINQAAMQISPLIQAHRIDDAIHLIEALEVRTLAFRLQGLGHLYKDADSRLFKDIRQVAKNLEDALGAYDLARELHKAALKTGRPDLIARLGQNRDEAKQRLGNFLVSDPILGNPLALRNFIIAVENFHWAKPEKDREYVLKQLIDMVDDLNSNVKHDKYTRDDIENGLHELRRQLRWFLICALAMDGLVSDQSNPPNLLPGWQQYVSPTPGPYIRFSLPYTTDPILVPKVTFAALSKLVVDLGQVKDNVEIQVGLGLPGIPINHKLYASQTQAVIVRDGILQSLEKILRDQRR